MEYGRSGLAVHFARCNQMNEEQRRIKTAARIREMGRRNTDLSVELNEPKKQVKQVTQEVQQSKEEGIDAAELQKKLANMVKRVKDEQAKWKEERLSAQSTPPPFFQEEMDSRGNQDEGRGEHQFFRGKFQNWLQDEYRYSNRAPPQHWMDRACKGENCSTCAKCPRCRIGLCMGGRWMKIGNHFKPTHSYATIFLAHQKLKTSRNYQQLNWLKAYRKISVLGVD